MQHAYTIFDLRRAYHASLANMHGWLWDSALSARLTNLDRMSIMDAWHQEMVEFFERHGFCLTCSRALRRCVCSHDDGEPHRFRAPDERFAPRA